MKMAKMTKRSHRKHPQQRKSPRRKSRVKAKKRMRRSVAQAGVGVAAGAEAAAKRKERKVLPIKKSPQTRRQSPINPRRKKESDHLANGSLKLSVPAARLRIT
jgi:hypothetical protein